MADHDILYDLLGDHEDYKDNDAQVEIPELLGEATDHVLAGEPPTANPTANATATDADGGLQTAPVTTGGVDEGGHQEGDAMAAAAVGIAGPVPETGGGALPISAGNSAMPVTAGSLTMILPTLSLSGEATAQEAGAHAMPVATGSQASGSLNALIARGGAGMVHATDHPALVGLEEDRPGHLGNYSNAPSPVMMEMCNDAPANRGGSITPLQQGTGALHATTRGISTPAPDQLGAIMEMLVSMKGKLHVLEDCMHHLIAQGSPRQEEEPKRVSFPPADERR